MLDAYCGGCGEASVVATGSLNGDQLVVGLVEA